MSESKFKTMRHIETVRNYLNAVIKELLSRSEQHDQSKLQSPEVEIFEEYTSKLHNCTYGSDKYKQYMSEMKTAINHHHSCNKHHPEFYPNKIKDMTLIDLLEMLCDWKASSMRHIDGDLYNSLEINKERFNFDEDIYYILKNTIYWIEEQEINHHAEES